jgi:hypothetical protein
MNRKSLLIILIYITLVFSSCTGKEGESGGRFEDLPKLPPVTLPRGMLMTEISSEADFIISSVRYALNELACLDEDYNLKQRFIQDPDCNQVIYHPESGLGIPRQLFTLDIGTGEAVQITNTDCIFLSGQAINSTTLMTNAICEDTNNDGIFTEEDNPNLYHLDLPSGELMCLTCDFDLNAINNPDFSHITNKIVFSAQIDPVFHNYLFTIDLEKRLEQLTDDPEFMDFDCAWSEDGTMIAFNRLPSPWFEHPAQIWIMDADGGGMRKITNGGENPQREANHSRFPIGTDADADFSPDNSQIVFSRLRTGSENVPIGVWELIIIDLQTGVETILDSTYANMIPEWKSVGITFTRQIGGTDPMEVKQAFYLYRDGIFQALETYPYDVFPIGAFGGHWIVR